MINTISVKCPECGASLSFEENRKKAFCSYCGSEVILNKENEFIYRKIDDAKVIQAETDRTIRLKELEIKEQQIKVDNAKFRRMSKGRRIVLATLFSFFALMVIYGLAFRKYELSIAGAILILLLSIPLIVIELIW